MFMDALLGRSSAVRTVAVTFEPIPPERSTREVEAADERVERLTAGEIDARVEDLRGIGQFDHVPAPLEASLTTVAPPIET